MVWHAAHQSFSENSIWSQRTVKLNCIIIKLQILLAKQQTMKNFKECKHHKFFPKLTVTIVEEKPTSTTNSLH